jgi:hypothetical protein
MKRMNERKKNTELASCKRIWEVVCQTYWLPLIRVKWEEEKNTKEWKCFSHIMAFFESLEILLKFESYYPED